jgi:hypothetical protein
MDQDLKKLRKLVKFMQKEGVLTLKMSEIELQLSQAAILPLETAPDAPSPSADAPQDPEYTEEELLFWSSPGLPESEGSH